MNRLKQELEVVRQRGGGLVIVGDGSDGRTERERRLLANQRAIAFASWLARQGIDNPANLMYIADNGGYEGIYYGADNSIYQNISSLQMKGGWGGWYIHRICVTNQTGGNHEATTLAK